MRSFASVASPVALIAKAATARLPLRRSRRRSHRRDGSFVGDAGRDDRIDIGREVRRDFEDEGALPVLPGRVSLPMSRIHARRRSREDRPTPPSTPCQNTPTATGNCPTNRSCWKNRRLRVLKKLRNLGRMADREGFEPSIEFPLYTRSRRAPSTTRPPVRPLAAGGQSGAGRFPVSIPARRRDIYRGFTQDQPLSDSFLKDMPQGREGLRKAGRLPIYRQQ